MPPRTLIDARRALARDPARVADGAGLRHASRCGTRRSRSKLLEARQDCTKPALLLRDAFDMLEEDFEEEQFFATVRRAYWQAPAGSPTRKRADALIQTLEF